MDPTDELHNEEIEFGEELHGPLLKVSVNEEVRNKFSC